MDILSRVAFVAGALLDIPPPGRPTAGVVISTASGCIEVDKKFEESRKTIASPALFVYTLPNIMLGELCIRHGFKGAQMCFIEETPDPWLIAFHVRDLLDNRKAEACLCGHINATETQIDATLLWVQPLSGVIPFNEEQINQIYTQKIRPEKKA